MIAKPHVTFIQAGMYLFLIVSEGSTHLTDAYLAFNSQCVRYCFIYFSVAMIEYHNPGN